LKSCKSTVFDQNHWQYERERILCRVYGLVNENSCFLFPLLLLLLLLHVPMDSDAAANDLSFLDMFGFSFFFSSFFVYFVGITKKVGREKFFHC